jgi:hypothetical protein
MTERRDLGQQVRRDVVTGDEQLDRVDPGADRRVDEVLALDGEQPRFLARLARREKLPDEPELLVLARFDQALRRP